MEPFLGQIILLGFSFAPRGWALCAGQLLSIAQNAALFSILGTTYGGNGVTTFGLPDLRGRAAIHWGQGNGLSNYVIGEVSGTEKVTLLANQLPLHNHSMMANNSASTLPSPTNNLLAQGAVVVSVNANVYSTTTNATMSPLALNQNGSNLPVPILQPYTVLNYSIATAGIFPTRN